MPTRKQPKGQALKAIRSDLAKLKRAGLYKGDVRNAKGGWRQKALIKQYSDVIEGKAKTVKVGAKAAKSFDKSYKPKAGRVVVKGSKSEKFRYNKKTGQITATEEKYGVKAKRILLPKGLNPFQNLPTAPKGKVYLYQMPDGFRYDREGAQKFLSKYRHKKGIGDAVVILELDADDIPELDYENIYGAFEE